MLEGASKASRDWREQPDEFWSGKFNYPFTPRLALQLMGTEAGRNVFHQDLWVISLLNRHNQGTNSTVVTDVRFRNEFRAIQEEGGIIVRVRRGPDPVWYETAWKVNCEGLSPTEMIGVHQSEWDWIGCPINHTIYNDGTLSDLRDNVRFVVQNHEVFQRILPVRTTSDNRIRM